MTSRWSTGDPIAFTIDPLSQELGLSAMPSSGITPADITITAAPATLSGSFLQTLNIRNTPGAPVLVNIPMEVDEFLPGYVGFLDAAPMSSQFSPGAFFYIAINRPLPTQMQPVDADPSSLAFSLAGYSFQLGGIPVPLRSYANGRFVAQIPVDLKTGDFTLNAFDSTGLFVATGQVRAVTAVAPGYLVVFPNSLRAQKSDGSIIDALNPTQPGEAILVHVIGYGAVKPPIPSGQAGQPDVTYQTSMLLTATVGGKSAKVLSYTPSVAGVLDVWIEVPDLYPGDHYVRVSVGPVSTDALSVGPVPTTGVIPVRVSTLSPTGD